MIKTILVSKKSKNLCPKIRVWVEFVFNLILTNFKLKTNIQLPTKSVTSTYVSSSYSFWQSFKEN